MVANVDPIQHIHSEGFAYRSAVDGPSSLIVVIGIWLLFLPLGLGTLVSAPAMLAVSFPYGVLLLLLSVASFVMLFRSTRNYIVKSRAAADPLA